MEIEELPHDVREAMQTYIDEGYLFTLNEYPEEAWDEQNDWHWTHYIVWIAEHNGQSVNGYLFKSLDEVTIDDLNEIVYAVDKL